MTGNVNMPFEVLKLFNNSYNLQVDESKTDALLKEDLGFDSLTLVNLIVEIEEVLAIEFDVSDLDPNKLLTVRDLLLLINNTRFKSK